jgi:hypothetical protein
MQHQGEQCCARRDAHGSFVVQSIKEALLEITWYAAFLQVAILHYWPSMACSCMVIQSFIAA